MAFVSRGRRQGAAVVVAAAVPAGVKEPTKSVVAKTAFDPNKLYLVRLSGAADYQGTALSAMHLHTVKGTVAQAIRGDILAFAEA